MNKLTIIIAEYWLSVDYYLSFASTTLYCRTIVLWLWFYTRVPCRVKWL